MATKMIEKINNSYILHAVDGDRTILRDEESHNLLGVLLGTPAVGQAVIRNLSEQETAVYAAIRRSERNISKAEKSMAADAERKAEEKTAHRAAVIDSWNTAKAERVAAEKERAELREIRDELKKLEEKPEPKQQKQDVLPAELYAEHRKQLHDNVRAADKDLERAKGTSIEAMARAAYEGAVAELNELDELIKAETPVTPKAETEHAEVRITKNSTAEPATTGAVENNSKEGDNMRKVTNSKRLIEVLKDLHIPSEAIDELVAKYSVTDIRHIVFAESKEHLTNIKNIGEKRAELIIKALTGRIPEPLAVKKLTVEQREQLKAEIREKAKGFSCRSYEPDELWRHVWPIVECLKSYYPHSDEQLKQLASKKATDEGADFTVVYNKLRADEAKAKDAAKKLLGILKRLIFVRAGLTVRKSEGRIVRLSKSATTEVLGVDYESKKPTELVNVVRHGIQDVFDFSLNLFGNDKDEAQVAKDDFQKDVEHQLLWYGVNVVEKSGLKKLYTAVGSSAAHQKSEKILFGETAEMKNHEQFFWFGKSMDQFVSTKTTTGAEFWKARANLLRPWMKPFETGECVANVRKDLLVVKDCEKNYEILWARTIGKVTEGKNKGAMYEDAKALYKAILGDGAMISLVLLLQQGQGSGLLFKGFVTDGVSSIEEVCRKHGISIEEFMNMKVLGIDGKMHRVGDYRFICGEGCWKGDKVFDSYDEYLDWMDAMEEKHPGISNLYLLRQAEEIEDEEKVRRLTRTLIQQWMFMSKKEIRKITKRARLGLKKDKTFYGAVAKLAGLWKTDEERTEIEKLFEECPWLIMNPNIQDYLKERWERKQTEYASGKFKTEGQYPYIMQDPVALLEVWVLGMSPDDPTLGVLKNGEVSCADVPEGRELLCVRFPANFLTAQVRVNKACKRAFASLNNVMVLSIHDVILIIQDGDVDGDEMCVIYNKLAIRLTKRMNEKFNPPVVLFKHGGKPPRKITGSKEAFVREMAVSLWKAKKYDSVGLYANLAMRCAYLAAIAYRQNDMKTVDKYLLWMSAASTGAILAIDQVKGNDVDQSLINWLDSIQKSVDKAFTQIAEEAGFERSIARKKRNPFIQYFVAEAKRRPIGKEVCLPLNEDNFLDELSGFMLRDTGKWENFDTAGVVWNKAAAKEVLTSRLPDTRVPAGVVTKEMLELLGDNWFKLRAVTAEEKAMDKTAGTLAKMGVGKLIGFKDFVLLLWRNESSMAYNMDGGNLQEKKDEYVDVCRKLLMMLAESGDWSSKKGVTEKDRWDVVVNNLVIDALELWNSGNGLDKKKGSYAMFCLKLVAPELRENAKKNRVDVTRFFGVSIPIEDVMAEIELDRIEDEMELFEATPDQPDVSFGMPDDAPEYTDEELCDLLDGYDADTAMACLDDMPDDLPDDLDYVD